MMQPKKQMTDVVIKTSAASMPSSCWGTYCHIAILEVKVGTVPKAIDIRHKNIHRIVKKWNNCHVGSTIACETARCLAEASSLAKKITGKEVPEYHSTRTCHFIQK